VPAIWEHSRRWPIDSSISERIFAMKLKTIVRSAFAHDGATFAHAQTVRPNDPDSSKK
jgi:hypothetical protein